MSCGRGFFLYINYSCQLNFAPIVPDGFATGCTPYCYQNKPPSQQPCCQEIVLSQTQLLPVIKVQSQSAALGLDSSLDKLCQGTEPY